MILQAIDRNKFLIIAIIGVTVIVGFHAVPFSFKPSDTGNYIGIAALTIAAWQVHDARENKVESGIASIGRQLAEAISKVEAHSDQRDSLHEQQLGQIQQQLATLTQQSQSRQEDIRRLYDHIFENKDKLAEHGATLAVLGRQGEIVLAVGNMRSEIGKLQGEIEKIRSSADISVQANFP
ncbi:MAG: hypothetical protein AB1589_39590 [Cyanobacteriota bacterium]